MELGGFYALDIKNKAFGMWRHDEMYRHFGRTAVVFYVAETVASYYHV